MIQHRRGDSSALNVSAGAGRAAGAQGGRGICSRESVRGLKVASAYSKAGKPRLIPVQTVTRSSAMASTSSDQKMSEKPGTSSILRPFRTSQEDRYGNPDEYGLQCLGLMVRFPQHVFSTAVLRNVGPFPTRQVGES